MLATAELSHLFLSQGDPCTWMRNWVTHLKLQSDSDILVPIVKCHVYSRNGGTKLAKKAWDNKMKTIGTHDVSEQWPSWNWPARQVPCLVNYDCSYYRNDMKHFPRSPNNDSSFFTSLNPHAYKLKFGNRRYIQALHSVFSSDTKYINSFSLDININKKIYLYIYISARYATEWRRNASDGLSNFHLQWQMASIASTHFIQKDKAMQTLIPGYSNGSMHIQFTPAKQPQRYI